MTKMICVVLVVAICGCSASTAVPQYPNISDKQYVENKALPERPDAVAIAPDGDWVKPMKVGDVVDKPGVLLSPDKAARAKKWQDGYVNLRLLYETDRQIWQQHRIVYEERTAQANAEIKRLSPSWWDENKGNILWAGGFIMGAASSIAIVYGLDQVRQ
jgi:hypothetical protein